MFNFNIAKQLYDCTETIFTMAIKKKHILRKNEYVANVSGWWPIFQ